LKTNKKIYFVSDVHLGYPNHAESLIREKKLVAWLDEIKLNAQEIFLMGDIFDFWFEYKKVVPRNFTRFLAKIAEIADSGIPVTFFTGNHDIWTFDYLQEEIGVKIIRNPEIRIFNNKKFFLAHGDGLGPGDHGFKGLKKLFTSKFLQWCFARIHPNLAFAVAQKWSSHSRYTETEDDLKFRGEKKEWLILFANDKLKTEHFDFFVFGHRHIPLEIALSEKSKFINIGDWITNFTYAVFDGENLELKRY
jgi:UDP-2,3-diacylglucosamine hydrolase